jgi:hypothetical protein
MHDNPILPYSSLSDVIDKIKTAKTSNVCIFSWQSSAVQSSGGNSFAGRRVELE